MQDIRISIITVCFNSETTIERTIKSVIEQQYDNYEYIIIDGASRDDTLKIIRSYEPLFNGNLKWISEPDKGIYNAMNKGIKMATGSIVALVNSDDWLEPGALKYVSELYSKLELPDEVLYCGAIRYHYKDGSAQVLKTNVRAMKKAVKNYKVKGVRHPGLFVPINVYERVGIFDDNYHITADMDFIYRCFKMDIKFLDVNCVLNNMSDGGVSNSVNKKYYDDKQYFLRKFTKSRIRYLFYLYEYRIFKSIKFLTPDFFLKQYRNFFTKL